MKKIMLVVEDDPDLQHLLVRMFEDEGYTVEVASDGLEALMKIPIVQPNILLLDLKMPRMNGKTLLDELAIRDWRDSIRVIVVSALQAFESDGLPVDAVIAKPFAVEDLLAVVEEMGAE